MTNARPILAGALLALVSPIAAQPVPSATRWWRGNLHTHSLWSDGNDFPEMIADWYRAHGYDFLALSDHNVLSDHERWIDNDDVIVRGGRRALARYRERFGPDWVETREVDGALQVRLKTLAEFRGLLEAPGEFLLLQAEEVSDSFARLPIHLNATNLDEVIPPQGGGSVREVIRNNLRAIAARADARAEPVLGHLNHPNFGWAVTAEDLAHVVEERFFEVFNGHPAVHNRGDATHASTERIWDVANTIRLDALGAPPLFGLGTDDSHNYHGAHGATPGRGWIMVRAARLEPRALLEAMQRGDFYASSGVELEDVRFDPERRELSLRIAARPGERYVTRFVGTERGHDPSSAPVLDPAGQPVRATRRYSDEIGCVLAEVEGEAASYRCTGRELYVRAVVTSSAEAENPTYEGAPQQAWTQPVGWR